LPPVVPTPNTYEARGYITAALLCAGRRRAKVADAPKPLRRRRAAMATVRGFRRRVGLRKRPNTGISSTTNTTVVRRSMLSEGGSALPSSRGKHNILSHPHKTAQGTREADANEEECRYSQHCPQFFPLAAENSDAEERQPTSRDDEDAHTDPHPLMFPILAQHCSSLTIGPCSV